MRRNIYEMQPDSRKFARIVRRDALLVFLIITFSYVAVVLIPLVAYLASKGG